MEETVAGAGSESSRRVERLRRWRALTLLLLVVAYVMLGAVWTWYGLPEVEAQALAGVPTGIATLVWVQLDALERARRIGVWFRIGLLLLPSVFVVVWLVRTRRRRALISIALLVPYVVLLGVAGIAGVLIAR